MNMRIALLSKKILFGVVLPVIFMLAPIAPGLAVAQSGPSDAVKKACSGYKDELDPTPNAQNQYMCHGGDGRDFLIDGGSGLSLGAPGESEETTPTDCAGSV